MSIIISSLLPFFEILSFCNPILCFSFKQEVFKKIFDPGIEMKERCNRNNHYGFLLTIHLDKTIKNREDQGNHKKTITNNQSIRYYEISDPTPAFDTVAFHKPVASDPSCLPGRMRIPGNR
jgi:hypothetical protein